MLRSFVVAFAAVMISGAVFIRAEESAKEPAKEPLLAPPPSDTAAPAAPEFPLNEAEKAFKESFTRVNLVGFFTMDNKTYDQGLPEDSYTIQSAEKIGEDTWRVTAIIDFGKMKLPIPLPVKVYWAGDTPVLSVTDLMVPGMGKYSARIVFHKDQYAGTWSGTGFGGKLIGKLVKMP